MRLRVVQRILGLLLMLFSVTMLPPVAVSWFFEDGSANAFLYAFGFTIVAGVLIWLPVRFQEEDLRLRGAGEMLGTRQSGVPEFRVADLGLHGELLAAALQPSCRPPSNS